MFLLCLLACVWATEALSQDRLVLRKPVERGLKLLEDTEHHERFGRYAQLKEIPPGEISVQKHANRKPPDGKRAQMRPVILQALRAIRKAAKKQDAEEYAMAVDNLYNWQKYINSHDEATPTGDTIQRHDYIVQIEDEEDALRPSPRAPILLTTPRYQVTTPAYEPRTSTWSAAVGQNSVYPYQEYSLPHEYYKGGLPGFLHSTPVTLVPISHQFQAFDEVTTPPTPKKRRKITPPPSFNPKTSKIHFLDDDQYIEGYTNEDQGIPFDYYEKELAYDDSPHYYFQEKEAKGIPRVPAPNTEKRLTFISSTPRSKVELQEVPARAKSYAYSVIGTSTGSPLRKSPPGHSSVTPRSVPPSEDIFIEPQYENLPLIVKYPYSKTPSQQPAQQGEQDYDEHELLLPYKYIYKGESEARDESDSIPDSVLELPPFLHSKYSSTSVAHHNQRPSSRQQQASQRRRRKKQKRRKNSDEQSGQQANTKKPSLRFPARTSHKLEGDRKKTTIAFPYATQTGSPSPTQDSSTSHKNDLRSDALANSRVIANSKPAASNEETKPQGGLHADTIIPLPSVALNGVPFFIEGQEHLGTFVIKSLQ